MKLTKMLKINKTPYEATQPNCHLIAGIQFDLINWSTGQRVANQLRLRLLTPAVDDDENEVAAQFN